MRVYQAITGAAVAMAMSAVSAIAQAPSLTAAVLEAGTVNWELDTIKHYELDKKHGFDLQVMGVAGGSAGDIAFQGGEADVMVSDWLWVARQRASGKDYSFIPYSKAVGGVMIRDDNDAQTLQDLAGGKIGIAGGPLDKSWLILRAYAQQEFGMDLANDTEQVFGAPPLIMKAGLDGEVDGAINYWHFLAKMEAAGMHTLIAVDEAAEALGLDPETPLLGYVVKGEMIEEQPEVIAGLAAASREAKELLATDDAAWDRLRDRMNAKSDAEFEALKEGFRAGIPNFEPVDEQAVDKMLKLMAELGGEELVGDTTELPDGVFIQPGS